MLQLLSLLFSLGFCQLSPIYPVPWFYRTVSYLGLMDSAYCVNDGTFGAQQGVGSQQYTLTQPCSIGQINSERELEVLDFGDIGSVGTAYVNLGTTSQISYAYNLTYPIFSSLVYDTNSRNVGLASPNRATVFLNKNQTGALLTTAASTRVNIIPPLVGTVWLVRFTNSPITTKTVGDQTTAIIVGIVTSFNSFSVTLQWGVIASTDPAGATAAGFPQRPGGYLRTTYNIAVTALLFSIFIILGLAIYVVILMKGKGTAFGPLLGGTDAEQQRL